MGMAGVVWRKLALLLIFLPLLHVLGFWYATSNIPDIIFNLYGFPRSSAPTEPFPELYSAYLQGVAQGEFGDIQGQPLTRLLVAPLQRSAALLICSFVVVVLLGPLLGLLAIDGQTGRARTWPQLWYTAAASIPGFFVATLLITVVLYAARTGLFFTRQPLIPVQGHGYDAHLIVPVLALAFRPTFFVAALTSSLIEQELQLDYIRVARSKGLRWKMLLLRHALPNVAAQIMAALGQTVRLLASTLILVETVVDWRGVGRLLMQVLAVGQRGDSPYYLDPPLLAFLVVVFGGMLLVADLCATMLGGVVDPRLREEAA